MFVKLFDTNNPLALILIFITGGIFWADSFIHPVLISEQTIIMPFYYLIFSILNNNVYLFVIIAFLILFIEAIILNQIVIKNKIFARNSFLPALVYMLLLSSYSSLQTLTPVIIANLFLIIALQKIFDIYDDEEPYAKVFNIGFLASLASLFYFYSLFFLVVIWASFIIYRIYNWREWLISLIGIITPYLFIGVWLFWHDKLNIILYQFLSYFRELNFNIHHITLNIQHFKFNIYLLAFGILTTLSLVKVLSKNREKLIKTRSSFHVLTWFLLLSLFFLFIGSDNKTSFF